MVLIKKKKKKQAGKCVVMAVCHSEMIVLPHLIICDTEMFFGLFFFKFGQKYFYVAQIFLHKMKLLCS